MSRPKCYFMVWSPLGYHLEIVSYDPEFWADLEVLLSTAYFTHYLVLLTNNKDTLENFYMNCLLPEIVDPRAPRGLPIREPDYIVQVNT